MAEAAGLGNKWDSLRTHQYLIEEGHYTAHWTTQEQEAIKDSKGNTTGYRTVTKHHYSSHQKDVYGDFVTPSNEVAMDRKIQELQSEIIASGVDLNKIRKIQAQLQELILSQAKYTATDSDAPHDYSKNHQARNMNQLKQLETLYEQTALKTVAAQNGLADYNRQVSAPPSWKAGVQAHLNAVDKNHGRHLRILGFTTGAAALAGTACYLWMSGAFAGVLQ
jgi:hypothetical protein